MANFRPKRQEDFVRVNRQIRVPKIRVLLEDGELLGIMAPQEALRKAEDLGKDLVEISPKAQPPVCKIMDYGKYKYELKKKKAAEAKKSKKAQSGNIIKEITLSPQTDVHDLNTKMRNCIRFLGDGNKVKVTVRFRGREMAHPEIGAAQLKRVFEALEPHGNVEGSPKMEGRFLMAIFAPISASKGKKAVEGFDMDAALKSATKNVKDRRPPMRPRRR